MDSSFYRTLIVSSLLVFTGCAKDTKLNIKEISATEIADMEKQANVARNAFFKKDYITAINRYEPLLKDMTVNSPLYLLEQATSYWLNNDNEQARKKLLLAESLLRDFYDAKSEESAISLWGSESEKVYKGDPYEQTVLYIFLGLMLLENGDIDNALASFKSAQLADSDSKNALYQTDFGLAQFLEAYCYKLLDKEEAQQTSLNQSISSFTITHPQVKDLINKKQALLKEIEELDSSEKIALAEKLKILNSTIDDALKKVDLSYIKPLYSDFNTLLLIWNGKSPIKQGVGEYGEKLVIIKNPTPINRYEIQVDNNKWVDGLKGMADISYQATTRGGRLMDDVLEDQAAFKKASYQVGNVLVTAGAAVALGSAQGGSGDGALIGVGVGAGMMLLGGIAYGVGSLTSVEADIRSWKVLPNELMVVPLNLTPGKHQFNIDSFEGYIQREHYSLSADIYINKPLNIILAVPQSYAVTTK